MHRQTRQTKSLAPHLSLLLALALLLLASAPPTFISKPSQEPPPPMPPDASAASPAPADPHSVEATQAINAGLPEDGFTLYLPFIARQIPNITEDLADGWYLMVDDGHLVSNDLQRVYHSFNKYSGNPVLRADRPWEGKVVQLYGTALPSFRLWYSSYNHGASITSYVLYADSIDGYHWYKPPLSGTGTNSVFGGTGANMVSVMHTPLDAEHPYKLVVFQDSDFHAYRSHDGIHNIPFPENPVFLGGSDLAQFYYDQVLDRYGGTAKVSVPLRSYTRRAVSFIHSPDLVNWEIQPEILAPDIIDDQIYPGQYPNFYGLPVFRIGEQYLGLLWVLKATEPAGQIGKVSIQLVSSHDGVKWQRETGNRPPILDVGPFGAWDDGQIYTAIQPLRVNHELWLYYSGCDREHGTRLDVITCSIGLAKAPLHRLASLSGTGAALTEELDPEAKSLHLNYDGSRGSLLVQLMRDGAPIPGYEAESCMPLTGDSLDQMVSWSGGSNLPDGPFQVQFRLQEAALYAFTFKK